MVPIQNDQAASLDLALTSTDMKWEPVARVLLFKDAHGNERSIYAQRLATEQGDKEGLRTLKWALGRKSKDLFRSMYRRGTSEQSFERTLYLCDANLKIADVYRGTLSKREIEALASFKATLDFGRKPDLILSAKQTPMTTLGEKYHKIDFPKICELKGSPPDRIIDLFDKLSLLEDELTASFGVKKIGQKTADYLLSTWLSQSWDEPDDVLHKSILGPYIKHGLSLQGSYDEAQVLITDILSKSPFASPLVATKWAKDCELNQTRGETFFLKLRQSKDDLMWTAIDTYHRAFLAWRFTSTLSHKSALSEEGEFNILIEHASSLNRICLDLIDQHIRPKTQGPDHFANTFIRRVYPRIGSGLPPEFILMRLISKLYVDMLHDAFKRVEILDRKIVLPKPGTKPEELEQQTQSINRMIRVINKRCLLYFFAHHLRLAANLGAGTRRYWHDTLLRLMSRLMGTDTSYIEVLNLLSYLPIHPELDMAAPKNEKALFHLLFELDGYVESLGFTRSGRSLQDQAWRGQGLKTAMSGENSLADMARDYWSKGKLDLNTLEEQLRAAGMGHSHKGIMGLTGLMQMRNVGRSYEKLSVRYPRNVALPWQITDKFPNNWIR